MSALSDFLASVRDSGSAVGHMVRDLSNSPGAAPLHAAWRGGLKDLQDALIPAFPESMKAREEPGSIASPTPQLVTESMTGRGMDIHKDELRPQKDSPEMDIDR